MSPSLHDQITRRYYETTAGRSHAPTREYYNRSADGLMRRLRPWLPKDREARCLDLGCGCGDLMFMLEREGFRHTVGVNLCEEELDMARPYVKGELNYSEVLDYLKKADNNSMDYITALNFLEHLPKDKLHAVLSEISRILRPGGALVAMVPNAVSPFGGLTRHWDMTHEWAFTPNNFSQLAPLAGFDPDVEFRECGPVAHGIISGARFLLWQAIRAGIATWFLIEVGNPKGGIYTMDMLVRLKVLGK